VHVAVHSDGGHRLLQPVRGDTVSTVLRAVHFDPERILAVYREKTAQASWLSVAERQAYLKELASGLDGYTYLED
jgi:arginine decarboxylase